MHLARYEGICTGSMMEENKYLIDYYNQDREDERLLSKHGCAQRKI
ncbi:MAG: hypothetical protein FWC13_08410 [Oscillospiraceae bacterium]|nr:hypothetical protein [Oscillospiraceae bacterium]